MRFLNQTAVGVILGLAVGASAALGMQVAEDVTALIEEGVRLHDEGDYAGAVAEYEKALKLEPENVLTLYEMAYSLSRAGNLEECVEAALRGIKIASRLQETSYVESNLFVVGGSCYSVDDKPKKA